MIVCVGTTPCYQRTMTFERLTLDAVNRTGLVHDYASGKSVNAARVLHELGEPHLAIGFAGGSRGNDFLADLSRAGIAHDFVIVERETRQCITLVADAEGTATELVEESQGVGGLAWSALAEKLQRQTERTSARDVWLFSGTLPPTAPADFYARFVPAVLARGAQVVADLSAGALRSVLAVGNVLAKINHQELEATFDAQSEAGEMPDEVEGELARGNRFVITLGKQGAVAADATGTWSIRTIPLRAVSAVGSGDAFAAGLCAGLSRGEALAEACRLGAACGAANALTPFSGHVSRADVERFLREITAERMAE